MLCFALRAYEQAVERMHNAIRSEHAHGLSVSVQHVEMLVSALTRQAQQTEAWDEADKLLDQALRTLDRLDALAEGGDADASTAERCGLRGSALKRRAQIVARRLGAGDANPETGVDSLRTALDEAANAYEKAGRKKETDVYPHLNALALRALLLGSEKVSDAVKKVDSLRQQVADCCKDAKHLPYPWSVVTPADAKLVEWLLMRSRGKRAREAAFQFVCAAYREVCEHAVLTPAQMGSIRDHLACLGDIAQALPMSHHAETSECLRELAEQFPRFQQAASAE